MDACMRNLNFVQHMAALNSLDNRSEMNEKGVFRSGHPADHYDDEVVCPKPRRMALSCCAPEIIKPLLQLQSRSSRMLECDAGCEILEIFLNKSTYEDDLTSFGCSPPYCSPPRRASNPIVHDVQFYSNQKSGSPIKFSNTKPMTCPSFPATPTVRIEGFDCSKRETQHDVHAYA